MDIPGPRDAEGRAPFVEYPVLENPDKSIRMIFTYESDISSDLEGNKRFVIDQEFKIPWLRLTLRLKEQNLVFFRIYRKEKSIFNKIKDKLKIVPGTKLGVNENSVFLYYINCSGQEKEIIEKIYVSGLIQKLGNFKNMQMIRIDSKDLTIDIRCDNGELYSDDLIGYYLKTADTLMHDILKL